MTTAIKRRRGTTTQHSTFTGLEGELTVDTTKKTVVVHDGATAGGFPLLKESAIGSTVQAYDADLTNWAGKTAPTGDAVGTSDSQTLTNKTISGASNTLSNIGNSSLTNSAVTIGSTSVSLGATASSIAGLTLTGAAVNGTVGASTPSTGSFTTLTTSGTTTLSGGTANGVAYLNGSKVLTTGSALTFDGSNLTTSQSDGYNGLRVSNTSGKVRISGYVNSTVGAYIDSLNAAESAYASMAINANPLQFHINGSEQMRLTSTGLGIGTSSPGNKLSVVGAANTVNISNNGVYYTSGTGNNAYVMNSAGLNYGTIQNDGADAWSLGYSSSAATLGTSVLKWNSSGNLGLGVTPSAWASAKALQINTASSLFGFTNDTHLAYNSYYSATGYKYLVSDYASDYQQTGGQHRWFTAPSGTAGNAITFTQAMTLDASGNLGVGTTIPTSLGAGTQGITVNGSAGGYYLCNYNGANIGYLFGDSASLVMGSFTSKSLIFKPAGSEAMRIDSSGNVGIGTSSPVSRVDVVANTPAYLYSPGQLNVRTTEAQGAGKGAMISLAGYSNATSTVYNFGVIGAYKTNSTSADYSSYMIFGTSDVYSNVYERMRIDSSGNLLVGKTSGTGYRIEAQSDNLTTMYINRITSTGNLIDFAYAGTINGRISTNGTNVTYGTSSDYRLKENVQPMQNALGVVAQLNPVTYTWKADGSDGQGFIAHELQAVVPDCVTGEKDAVDAEGKPVYQGIDTSFLVGILTKAIQELKAELDATKAEVAALKGN